jgi:hypothetical protein
MGTLIVVIYGEDENPNDNFPQYCGPSWIKEHTTRVPILHPELQCELTSLKFF